MRLKTTDIVLSGLFAALTAILAQIAIPLPFTTVPLTMLIFSVALAGMILGSKRGFLSMVIYLLLGAVGMPVFAQMSGGIGILLGPTGGFLLGCPIMAFIVGFVSERYSSKLYVFVAMTLGLVMDYAVGTVMFSIITKVSIYQSILYCVAPFVFVDLIKIILAISIGVTVSKRIRLV
ncbi:biotin transporter BioY [Romboutsia sp. Marseille-P6047]|uniref:biotin transporter BioY n=1 Tax=Romboutsia sp. Marseille-P6047 TaxID=2161817 RepID=UPI000F06849E|nr:biotin transporter BioY [Romboutsia sp. Marseille-P6047]